MQPLLTTQNLGVQTGNKQICTHLNWQIKANEIWGILGPNGCGKTSLLHTLAYLKQDFTGKILLSDICIRELESKKRAQMLGILLQNAKSVFASTVFEYCAASRFPYQPNLLTPAIKKNDFAIVQDALACMQLTALATRLTNSLSGGELKRLRIAALLAQTPKIYLLDEPTNDLDISLQIKSLQHLTSLPSKKSSCVIMSLHDINAAQRFCTHIMLLFKNGKILFGEKDKLMHAELLSELYAHKMLAITHQGKTLWQPIYDD